MTLFLFLRSARKKITIKDKHLLIIIAALMSIPVALSLAWLIFRSTENYSINLLSSTERPQHQEGVRLTSLIYLKQYIAKTGECQCPLLHTLMAFTFFPWHSWHLGMYILPSPQWLYLLSGLLTAMVCSNFKG